MKFHSWIGTVDLIDISHQMAPFETLNMCLANGRGRKGQKTLGQVSKLVCLFCSSPPISSWRELCSNKNDAFRLSKLFGFRTMICLEHRPNRCESLAQHRRITPMPTRTTLRLAFCGPRNNAISTMLLGTVVRWFLMVFYWLVILLHVQIHKVLWGQTSSHCNASCFSCCLCYVSWVVFFFLCPFSFLCFFFFFFFLFFSCSCSFLLFGLFQSKVLDS